MSSDLAPSKPPTMYAAPPSEATATSDSALGSEPAVAYGAGGRVEAKDVVVLAELAAAEHVHLAVLRRGLGIVLRVWQARAPLRAVETDHSRVGRRCISRVEAAEQREPATWERRDRRILYGRGEREQRTVRQFHSARLGRPGCGLDRAGHGADRLPAAAAGGERQRQDDHGVRGKAAVPAP